MLTQSKNEQRGGDKPPLFLYNFTIAFGGASWVMTRRGLSSSNNAQIFSFTFVKSAQLTFFLK
jgi:hypothetical protein